MYRSHVVLGNDVISKCEIPSFVSDFVSVSSWIISKDSELSYSDVFGKEQTVLDDHNLLLVS